MAVVLNVVLRFILYRIANNSSTYGLGLWSVILGVSLGIFLPLFSNILPIQKALGKNLRASLDMYHRSVGELAVSIKSLEEYGLSISQLLLAVILVVFGVATYYVAPSAFLFGDYTLFFNILNALLLVMIIGLTLLTVLLLPKTQRLFINIFMFCCFKDRKLKALLHKNLQSHSRRNQKTAIMFTLCLSFLIFAGSTFSLIGHLLES